MPERVFALANLRGLAPGNHYGSDAVAGVVNLLPALPSLGASHRLARDYQNAADGRVYNTGFRELTVTGMVGVQKS